MVYAFGFRLTIAVFPNSFSWVDFSRGTIFAEEIFFSRVCDFCAAASPIRIRRISAIYRGSLTLNRDGRIMIFAPVCRGRTVATCVKVCHSFAGMRICRRSSHALLTPLVQTQRERSMIACCDFDRTLSDTAQIPGSSFSVIVNETI